VGFLDDIKKMFSPKDGENRASLSKRVQVSPQDPQARQKLGIYLLRQGEVVEGLDQLARAAVMYEKDGFAGKAVAVLRHMLKNDPANLDFLRWLIRLYSQEGLTADAQRELENVAGRQGMFSSDEQKIEFLRQAGESLPKSPLPFLFIADVLCSRRKLHEAINELAKASRVTVSSRMVSEFSERLTAVIASAGDDAEVLEPCGFLWLKVGKIADGMSLLESVVKKTRDAGNLKDAAEMERIIRIVRDEWDMAAMDITSFSDAALKMEELAAPSVEESASVTASEPGNGSTGGEAAYREEESIVMDALSRLQAKVEEEIGESDPDARYNLGIAFKEMGLLDEAIGEFRHARHKPELFVGASSLLADTFVANGDFPAALAVLDEVLASGNLTEEERRNVRYQKALLLSGEGKDEEANEIFVSIHEEAPQYMDVASRVERHRG
jgi:tetratricopeptide (TPR) repeat protein